ncbi:MAG: DUF1367 family protein [Gammaproteobacteria bacterium]
MTKLVMSKRLGGLLEPADDIGVAALQKFKAGDIVRCEIRKPRNPDHHRLFMALLSLAFASTERFENPDALRAWVKCKAGHADYFPMKDRHCPHCGAGITGDLVAIPKPMNFAAMDQPEFDAFFDRAMDVISREFGITPETIREEIT